MRGDRFEAAGGGRFVEIEIRRGGEESIIKEERKKRHVLAIKARGNHCIEEDTIDKKKIKKKKNPASRSKELFIWYF